MPESVPSLPEVRCSALKEFVRKRAAPECGKSQQWHSRRTSPIPINKARKGEADVKSPSTLDGNGRSATKARGRGGRRGGSPTQGGTEPPPQPPGRKPGSSIYYGVRFRPDLNKWVAEIRVAEWKAVDKKVWLGTFDTQEGAARGVDLARKLLKCKKKHEYNLPGPQLDAYSGQIPADLVLSDVTTTSMFKAATLFIKRECQEYAASFGDSPANPTITQTPATLNMTNHLVCEANSMDSEILDLEVGNESSDSDESSMMMGAYGDSISINDYLDVGCYSFEHTTMQTTMSQLGASPSSCTSAMSCMTFDNCLADQCVDVADQTWDQMVAELGGEAGCILSTRMMQGEMPGGVQGGVQGGMQGTVSQDQCFVADQCTWPDPGSSSALVPLPGSYYEITPHMPCDMDGAFLGSDDSLSFQNLHYPFPFNKWC